MSLFSDAEKIENSSALTEAMAIEKARFRKGRILFAAMLLLIAGACFAGCYYYEKYRLDNAVAVQKENIIGSFDKKLSAIKKELTLDDSGNYPYVEPSKPHEFNVKHLADMNERQYEYVYDNGTGSSSGKTGNRIENQPSSADSSIDEDVARINQALHGGSTGNESDAFSRNTTTATEKRKVVKKDLKEIFNEAVTDTNSGDLRFNLNEPKQNHGAGEAMDISSLPEDIRSRIPPFIYSSHNYSTDAAKRSITLNGNVIKEGGRFKNLDILKIADRYVIMRIGGQSFSVTAMEDNRK